MSRSSDVAPRRPSRFAAGLIAVALGLSGALVPVLSASAAVDVTGTILDQLGDPVAGIPLEINKDGLDYDDTLSTNADGEFTIPDLEDASYEVFFHEGTQGTGGERFSVGQRRFDVAAGVATNADLVVNRYVPLSGTIANWTSAMGPMRVILYVLQGTQWRTLNINPNEVTTSGSGDFELSAPVEAKQYTLNFIAENESSPYLDAYLGGELDDPALAQHTTGTPGVGISFPAMTMPPAASISGRVTGDGQPLEGIEVEAQGELDYAYAETDALGDYTIYVRPASDYLVYTEGDDDFAGMIFSGWDYYGPGGDLVATSLLEPADEVDFALVSRDGPQIRGYVEDQGGVVQEDLEVRLYRAVGGVWALEDATYSYDDEPNFQFFLDPTGRHRVQFVDSDGDILSVVGGAYGSLAAPESTPLSPAPGCWADLGDIQSVIVAAATVDPGTPAGACTSLAGTSVSGGTGSPGAGPGSGGSTGGSTGVRPRPASSGSVPAASPTATAVPTTSPTPTASATPRPSASPTPSGADPVDPAPASAPDLWWLLWVGLGLLVIVVVAGVVFFIRRM